MFAALTLLIAVAACHGGPSGMVGNSASFGDFSTLESHYVLDGSDEPIPVCHVLFVPQWKPRVEATFDYGGGGDERSHTFTVAYAEKGVQQFAAQSVKVTRRFLRRDIFEGGGRRFDLSDGNIFVVAVARDGSLRVSQVPRLEGTRQPSEILAAVKKALPNDARVQALHLTGS